MKAPASGWKTYGQGRWGFADGINQIPGIDTASLRVTPAREPLAVDVKFKVKAHGNIDVIKPVFPGVLTLIFNTAARPEQSVRRDPGRQPALQLPERRQQAVLPLSRPPGSARPPR